ncbi:MAG: PmoA family protein [Phycisphaeraceae bacterium]|nr:PmoA family protein [Phycisphaeraceae bacterium]
MSRTLVLLCVLSMSGICMGLPEVSFEKHVNRIDVNIGGKLFTSYVHQIDPGQPLIAKNRLMTKPVLFPVYSPSGTLLTRAYPFMKKAGEKSDHPHHMGVYFTIDINKDNFWGNSQKPLPAIKHVSVDTMEPGFGKGTLSTTLHWIASDGVSMLEEKRVMVFRVLDEGREYAIDASMTLKALNQKVVFSDTKEGMMAVRVAPWLKEEGGTGQYLSSNGERLEKGVWGKRAKWMRLQGQLQDKTYGIAIFNHPASTNYPTYWHARGYGCFSANPLGQGAFQKGKKVKTPEYLNLALMPGESALFKHRLSFYEGPQTQAQLEKTFSHYTSSGD